ncbi:MAG: ABC transporter ATP-binding protein [Planctomycetia bacterium]|nr:ABC transporter ATP-binding protein [Planctomycetia bacterium]
MTQPSNDQAVITLSGITKKFNKQLALDNVSYTVKPGQVFALLGENGAGKTTTIRILLGLLRPDQGEVQVLGMNPLKKDLELRRQVGYVPDSPSLYEWMTVDAIGQFIASFHSEQYWQEYRRMTDSFGLPGRAKIATLSKGMKAEVSLALALASDPQLLILDEPTSGLDAVVRRRFLESMVDRAAVGKTVFLSSHQIAEVERVADTVAIMKQSHVVFTAPVDTLKATSRSVTLVCDSIPENLENRLTSLCETLYNCEIAGREIHFLARNGVANLSDRLAALPGVVSVTEKIPSLEEIFIAVMKTK